MNRNIRKYNNEEIKSVLKEYQTLPKDSVEEAQDLYDKLFMATISGSEEARKYFVKFKMKFPYLGEHFEEDYGYARERLLLWDVEE